MADFIVKQGGVVKSLTDLVVKTSGTVKSVQEGWVKQGGVVKQFWPSVPPIVPGVQNPLILGDVTGEALFSGTAIAGIKFREDGRVETCRGKVGVNVYNYVDGFRWYNPDTAGIGTSYEVRVTHTGGDPPDFGVLNQWTLIDDTLIASGYLRWESLDTGTGGNPATYLDFEVRDVATQTLLGSYSNLKLWAEFEP